MAFTLLGKVRPRAKAAGATQKNRNPKVRRALRRNRVLVVTLLAVGGFVAVLTGLALAQGVWFNQDLYDQALGGTNKPPSGRFGAATALDEANSQVIVFGGFGASSASGFGLQSLQPQIGPLNREDVTWSLKGGKWRPENSIHSPSPRGYAAMAYDAPRGNIVLFGGGRRTGNTSFNPIFGDTWTWDGRDWTLQDPPKPLPEPRMNHTMVYDAHRKVVVMFGGRGLGAGVGLLNDTWTWNGSAWKKLLPATSPSPRHSHAMAYDVCNAQAVIFGGTGAPINNIASQPGETWTWDGETQNWTQKFPLLAPSSRAGASMAYSDVSGRVLLYGGLATDTVAGIPSAATDTDLWRWDGAINTWEKMNSEATSAADTAVQLPGNAIVTFGVPPARGFASFIRSFSGSSFSGFLLYGGTPSASLDVNGIGPPQYALADHWVFSEQGGVFRGTDGPLHNLGSPDTPGQNHPLIRRCVNPVPIPVDGAQTVADTGPKVPKFEAREGMREIARLPVLLGTDWPANQRDTHLYSSSNPPPNPNYTPPPDCPRREEENGGSTHLVTDQKRNRVYQFFICDPTRGYGKVGNSSYYSSLPHVRNLLIEAYHGTTLKPVGRAVARNVEGLPAPGTSFRDRLLHDAERGRFLIRSTYYDTSTSPARQIEELVIMKQDLVEKGLDPVVQRIPFGESIPAVSFYDHPSTGRAKLLITQRGTVSDVSALNVPPKFIQLDLENYIKDKSSKDWEALATGCKGMGGDGSTNFTNFKPMRSGDRIYNVCSTDTNKYGVVAIPITEGAGGSESPGTAEVFGGMSFTSSNWLDPQASRMLAMSNPSTVWPFDGKASRYVGRAQMTTGPNTSFVTGLDQETGRLYVHSADAGKAHQGGISILDTRLTPVSQSTKFPQFASIPGSPTIAVLPAEPGVPRRIFTRRAGGSMARYPDGEPLVMENEMFYRVIADEVPLPKQAEISDLDLLTIAVPEAPGKTEVSFDAEGSGYGIRLRSIGGVWSAIRPFQQLHDGLGGFYEDGVRNLSRPYLPGCLFPDRELVAGWVAQARLSDLDALARSSGLEVDSNSKTDLDGPFSRCQPSANASDLPPQIRPVFEALWPLWQMVQLEGDKAALTGTVGFGKDADGTTTATDTPLGTLYRGQDSEGKPTAKLDTPLGTGWDHFFKEVECVGDALATNQATVGNIYGSANCVQRQGLVEATARGSATGAGPLGEETSSRGFSVGEGYSNVTVNRDPVRGVVVTSVAVARGIQLPGASFGAGNLASLSIDRVETKAVAWSNGRPGEERALFTRIICGVHDPEGRIPNGCLTSAQQQQFVDNWNARWGINSKMFLPKPDPHYYQGSPGGYIAGVIKPLPDEIEDQLFAKDYQKEVPGLVIEFYKNSLQQGLGRQVLQLAAVRAVAGLGVQCNPDLIYSSSTNDCLALPDEVLEDLYLEEDEEAFFEDEEFEDEGGWTEIEAISTGESLGKKIGRLLDRLPILRRLPIRQMGEALLGASVWLLLFLPMGLATRRFALQSLARKA